MSKTGSPGANLILRQYKLSLMSLFMDVKFINPKLPKKWYKELGFTVSTLKGLEKI